MDRLRLLTYNVLSLDHADGPRRQEVVRRGLVDLAPDVVALQEVDSDGAARLQRSGVLARFPYAVTDLRKSPSGIGLWSHLPVADSQVQDVHGMAVIKATILVGSRRLRLYSVHTVAPLGDDRVRWQAQLRWVEQEIRAAAPDLVALQEVDPDGAAGLQRSGVLASFPYAVTDLRKSPSGIGLWSRLPVADSQVQDVHGMSVIKATILVGSHRLRLYSVHTVAPLGDDRVRWRAQLRWVEEEMRRERGPLVVAGDFNATRFHHSFRRLLSERLGDAHERRGRGWATTWPRN